MTWGRSNIHHHPIKPKSKEALGACHRPFISSARTPLMSHLVLGHSGVGAVGGFS